MPLAKAQIIPELLKECPELQATWDEHATYWEAEIPGDYTNASAIVHALIAFYERGETGFFPRFFTFVERLITDGDAEVHNIAVVGYLEDLQTVASWKDYGPEVFVQWLKPESRRRWSQIYQWWEGDKSLMDIVRDEAKQSGGQQ